MKSTWLEIDIFFPFTLSKGSVKKIYVESNICKLPHLIFVPFVPSEERLLFTLPLRKFMHHWHSRALIMNDVYKTDTDLDWETDHYQYEICRGQTGKECVGRTLEGGLLHHCQDDQDVAGHSQTKCQAVKCQNITRSKLTLIEDQGEYLMVYLTCSLPVYSNPTGGPKPDYHFIIMKYEKLFFHKRNKRSCYKLYCDIVRPYVFFVSYFTWPLSIVI